MEAASPSLADWFRARCGPTGRSTWLYEGGLYDPLTGDQIAHVEGLEIVQAVSNPTKRPGTTIRSDEATQQQQEEEQSKGKTRRHNKYRKSDTSTATTTTKVTTTETQANKGNGLDMLSIHDSLNHPHAKYQQAGTLLSRKIFIYRSKEDKKTLLQTIKLKPYSPERKIPVNQVVSAYATANTFIERSPKEWIVHGEWPDGRTVWNQATVFRDKHVEEQTTVWSQQDQDQTQQDKNSKSNQESFKGRQTRGKLKTHVADSPLSPSTKSLEFTVHVRPRSNRLLGSKKGPDLTMESMGSQSLSLTSNGTTPTATTTTQSPPRSSWFSFGPWNLAKMSTGARETYHYEWTEHANWRKDSMENDNKEEDEALRRLGTRRRHRILRQQQQQQRKAMKQQQQHKQQPLESSNTNNSNIPWSSTTSGCSVRYTRYGEGPVWYGPNRFCMLELRGKRWPAHIALPEHIASWCQRHGWDDATQNPRSSLLLEHHEEGNDKKKMMRRKKKKDKNNKNNTPMPSSSSLSSRDLILAFRQDDLNLQDILGMGQDGGGGSSSSSKSMRRQDASPPWWNRWILRK